MVGIWVFWSEEMSVSSWGLCLSNLSKEEKLTHNGKSRILESICT